MASNGRDALEIFPAEIWQIILEELRKQGSSSDVLNCSKVCTEFERILEPTKQEWLFGSVCPFIFPYLKGGELLACRSICKNWRRGVHHFLEDFETWKPFDEGTSDISHSTEYDPLLQKCIQWTNIKGEGELVKFLEAMKKKEMKTPFVARSLSLEGIEFFERALEIISLYEDHIWHLRFEPNLSDLFHLCQFHQILRQMLASTHNLRSLILDSIYLVPYLDDQGVQEPPEDHPLEISSLESLEIYTSSAPLLLILEKLMSKVNLGNLKCLRLHNYHSYAVQPNTAVRPFQHLTELRVSSIHWADLEHIFNMISPTAPLAKLSVNIRGNSEEDEIDFDRVCNLFSKWKGTLRMLGIKGCIKLSGPPISLSKLDAPNLKSLELGDITFGRCLLNPVINDSLEYLHISYAENFAPTVDPGKEFYECVFEKSELHKSSIWGEMKKLKVIRVERPGPRFDTYETIACTREMHEHGVPPKLVKIEY